jgi:hypothetical protein
MPTTWVPVYSWTSSTVPMEVSRDSATTENDAQHQPEDHPHQARWAGFWDWWVPRASRPAVAPSPLRCGRLADAAFWYSSSSTPTPAAAGSPRAAGGNSIPLPGSVILHLRPVEQITRCLQVAGQDLAPGPQLVLEALVQLLTLAWICCTWSSVCTSMELRSSSRLFSCWVREMKASPTGCAGPLHGALGEARSDSSPPA